MDSAQIVEALRRVAPEGAVEAATAADGMPTIYVAREHVQAVAQALRDNSALEFVFAADVTGVDFLPREPRFEIVYTLASLGIAGYGSAPRRLRLKVRVPGDHPRMPTLSGVWKSMNWGEREVYDLFGVHFDGHPDLRRILMPEDWEGFPARKDYPVQIKMKPKVYEPLQLTPQEFAANVRAERERAGRD
jgi:NADH-quinone oxidoreductase subunit C